MLYQELKPVLDDGNYDISMQMDKSVFEDLISEMKNDANFCSLTIKHYDYNKTDMIAIASHEITKTSWWSKHKITVECISFCTDIPLYVTIEKFELE